MAIKIFFDHQKFSTQRYGGISRYFANVIQAINQHPEFAYELGVLTSDCHYIKDINQPLNQFKNILKSPSLVYKINKFYCENLLKKNNYDIFHPTYYDPYFLNKAKKPVVVTIHDMTYEQLPEYFWAQDRLTFEKRLNIERADKIIAISESTKSDLLKFSNVNPDKVSVIYHGIDSIPLKYSPIKNLAPNYVLFVGDRGGYKNFYLFLKAFKQLSLKYKDIKAVLTGGGPLGIAETEAINRLNLNNEISHYHVNDEELNYLYHKALLFVYPSLCEGFGLPILEAFKANCPVLLSDIDCFKEIAEDAAQLFERNSWESLYTEMEKLINSDAERSLLINKGTLRLKDFTIEKSVTETLNLYKSML